MLMPRAVAMLLCLGLLLLGGPASAGSERDPEIEGADCGQPNTSAVGEEYVICKAWFLRSAGPWRQGDS